QHADADKHVGVEIDTALDEVVIVPRPGGRDRLVADMMGHGGSARAGDGYDGAALAQQPKLVLLQRLPDLVVGKGRIGGRRFPGLEGGLLGFAPVVVGGGRGRVVTVAIDDHAASGLESRIVRAWASSPGAALSAIAPIRRCATAVARAMSLAMPRSASVRATSSISAARRSPWTIIRSRL